MIIAGQQYLIGLKKESTRGTAVDPDSGYWIPWTTVDVKPNQKNKELEQAMGRITSLKDIKVLGWNTSISFEMAFDRKLIKELLEGLYGAISTSSDDPESGVNTHTFTVANTNVEYPSYTITLYNAQQEQQFVLGTIKSLTIPLKTDDIPMVKVEFLANKYNNVSGKTASYQTSNSIFSALDANFYIADTYSNIGSASAINIQSAEITFERTLVGVQYLGNDTYGNIVTTDFKASCKIVLPYSANTYNTLYTGHTQRAGRIKLVDSDETIGSSINPTAQFDFPLGYIQERAEKASIKEIVGEEFTFQPIDDTTNDISRAELITDV